MGMNPMAIFKAKKSWETFCTNHPKFPAFLQAAQSAGIKEGTVFEVSMTTPEGKTEFMKEAARKLTEFDEEIELTFTREDNKINITVPSNKFAGYGVIEIK